MSLKRVLLQVATAFWWGAAYVWAAMALEGFSPILLVALGMVLASLALLVVLEAFGGVGLASPPAPVPSEVPR